MARKGKSTEEIIAFLREAEVRLAQGETAGKICRGAGISEQTYYKWRREYGRVYLSGEESSVRSAAAAAEEALQNLSRLAA